MNLAKYVLGVAAKSNVEKRQVGCIIVTDQQTIVGEGFNYEDVHAEVAAVNNFLSRVDLEGPRPVLKAYVTHPPCPECAKILADYGIKEVEVVEAFMKFDGDKLRYDLIDGKFAIWCAKEHIHDRIGTTAEIAQSVRSSLWRYHDAEDRLGVAIRNCGSFYETALDFEKAIVEVLTFGARKYKANNWKKCSDTGRYLAAAHRHAIAVIEGEEVDPESGLHHFAHIGTNLMFLHVLGLNYDNSNT